MEHVVESVPCPLCAATDVVDLYGRDGWMLGRCRGCGFVRQDPRLSAEALITGHYDGWVQEKDDVLARPQDYEGLADWQPAPLLAFAAGVEQVDALRRRSGDKGVWFDVGASTGSLLVAARNAGWDVAGVEPGRAQVEVCQTVHGIDVVHGVLADVLTDGRLPDGHVEVLSYRHVLEHVHDPVGELALARRALAPDGLLLVEVPNLGGSRFRWGRARTALHLCSSFWGRLNLPEHLYYFTRQTLTRLLEQNGFQVLSATTYGRVRPSRSLPRRVYERVRDSAGLGNNLRVVAAPV